MYTHIYLYRHISTYNYSYILLCIAIYIYGALTVVVLLSDTDAFTGGKFQVHVC